MQSVSLGWAYLQCYVMQLDWSSFHSGANTRTYTSVPFLAVPVMIGFLSCMSKTRACWPAVCVVEAWLRWKICESPVVLSLPWFSQCCSFGSSLCSCFLLISFPGVFCCFLLRMLQFCFILTFASFLDWKIFFVFKPGKKNNHGNAL